MTRTEARENNVLTGLPTNPHYCPECFSVLKPYTLSLPTTTLPYLEWDHAHPWLKCNCGELVPHHQECGTWGTTASPTRKICWDHGKFHFGRLKGEKVYNVTQATVSQVESLKEPTDLPLSKEETWRKRTLNKSRSKCYNPPKVTTNQEQKTVPTLVWETNPWQWQCYLDQHMYNRQLFLHYSFSHIKVLWGSGIGKICLCGRFMAPVLAGGPQTLP